jgi:hypothetical protein
MLTLTPQQTEDILDSARDELVRNLILQGDRVRLLSPSQAAGILDVRPNTLSRLPIPRVALDSKLIKYRLSDLTDFIESRVER